MLSTPFQLSTMNTRSMSTMNTRVCWCCDVVVVVVVVVFIDIGVVAVVSSSSVSACQREGGFETDHNFISCVFISFSPLVVLALLAPPSDATPHSVLFHCLTSTDN